MSTRSIVLAGAAALAFAAAARSSAAGVLVVGPGQPYAQISAAVAAAANGDTILVKAGIYDRVQLHVKGVAIVAEVGAAVYVLGGVEIDSVLAPRAVVLDRLVCDTGGVAGVKYGLLVKNCTGAIRAQSCRFQGAEGVASVVNCNVEGNPDAFEGVRVDSSTDVSFTGCTLRGGPGAYVYDPGCVIGPDLVTFGGHGGNGLACVNSTVSLYASTCEGGMSGSGSYSKPGGDGIAGIASSLMIFDCTATGGSGGSSFDAFAASEGGQGGHGLAMQGGTARLLDSTLAGGVTGSGWGYPGGEIADPFDGGGTLVQWPGKAKAFGAFKVVREGQTLVLQLAGNPGETALLLAAPLSKGLLVPALKGTLCLDPALLIGPVAIGTITGAAPIGASIPIPALPAGVLGAGVFMQGALVAVDGSAILTPWGYVTLLSASL